MVRAVVAGSLLVALSLVACDDRDPSGARAGAAPASVPAPVRAIPGADRTPAFARWTPGLRFVFFSTNAVTQSDPGKMGMRRDPNGPIHDTKGGRWTLTKPVGGSSGGVGYTVIDVVAADAGGLVLDQRLYFLPQGERGPAVFTGSSGVRVTPAGGDFFVHPALLAKVELTDEGGLHVIHERFERDGRTLTALRYTANTAGYSSRVYDLESGVLLSETYAYKASQGAFNDDDRHIREAAVRTSGTHTFVSARTTSLPWLRGAMPAWVATTRRLVYRGSIVSRAPGLPDGTAGVTSTYTLRDIGASHALYDVSTVGDPQPGIPQLPSVGTFASGAGSSAGLWIDPASLAKLEPGRVLDEDAVLGARTHVAGAGRLPDGRAVVTITVDAALQRSERLYDVASGRLLSATVTDPIPGTNLTRITRLDLVAAE